MIKPSYVEATSYILPVSEKELEDVKSGPPPHPPSLTSKQGNKNWTIKKAELAPDS